MIQHKTQRTTSSLEKILATSSSRIPTFARYCLDVLVGNIPTSRLVFRAVERHIRDLETGHERGLRFDQAASARVIRFFRDYAPFQLAPFQQFIVGSLYGWKGADGFRRFRTCYAEIGKGNGKSPLVGGLEIYALAADRELDAEVYSAAVTKEQAKICHRDACSIRDHSAALRKRIQKHRDNLSVASTNSFCRPISSEHRGLDGKRVHFAGIDEVHEHPTPLVVDKMRAGTKARRQALIFLITNSGYELESVCYHWHEYSQKILEGILSNDAHFAFVCHLDACDECYSAGYMQPKSDCERCDSWLDEDTWIKANPGLGLIIQKKYLQEQVTEAVAMPSKENIVRRLNFCFWTNAETRAIGAQAWAACSGLRTGEDPIAWRARKIQELRGRRCGLGFDLGSTDDLTCTAYLFPKQNGVEKPVLLPFFYCPRNGVALRTQRDRIPYELWERQGFLKVTPGETRDDQFIRKDINDCARMFEIVEARFDPHRALLLLNELQQDGFSVESNAVSKRLQGHQQGFLSMHDPTDHFLNMITGQQFEHGGNPVLAWNADNLVVVTDAAGNKKPVKPNNHSSPKKIDGIVASILAVAAVDANPVMSRPRISRL
jgi:phage terminase large subunit-like protein